MLLRHTFLGLLPLLLSLSLAQTEGKPVIAGHKPFSTMLGTWEGEGWSMTGPGNRVEFKQTEEVEAKANGNVILVTGTGREPDSNEVAFEAFATAAYRNDGRVVWTAYNGSNVLEVELQTTENSFSWGFEVEGGRIRYTARIENHSWHQVGEFSPDGGETWLQTFEMNLKRTN